MGERRRASGRGNQEEERKTGFFREIEGGREGGRNPEGDVGTQIKTEKRRKNYI